MGLFGKDPTTVTREAILGALRGVVDPNLQKDVVTLGLVEDLVVEGGHVSFTLAFTNQPAPVKVELHSKARRAVSQLPGVAEVKVKMGTAQAAARPAHAPHAPPPSFIPEVKHTIAVSSGKGGVG